MGGVFISYRREDSAGHVGRLSELLKAYLPPEQLFLDLDTIGPGDDFHEVIDTAVRKTDVLLAVIGKRWFSADDQGNRRIEQPGDFVRLEIASALKAGIRVIPILVHGAEMPPADDLPPDLRELARRHAVPMTDARWDYDAEQLIKALENALDRRLLPRTAAFPSGATLTKAMAGVLLLLIAFNLVYGFVLVPESNRLLLLAVTTSIFALASLAACALLLFARRREPSPDDAARSVSVPFYNKRERRRGIGACGTALILCVVTAAVALDQDRRLTPVLEAVSVDAQDPGFVQLKGQRFGADAGDLGVLFEADRRTPVSVRRGALKVAVPDGFIDGSVLVRRGPRPSFPLHLEYSGIVYDAAVIEMFNPVEHSRIQAIMDRIEPCPAFPYYSGASDHQTAWPPRADEDRRRLANKLKTVLEAPAIKQRLRDWEASGQAPEIDVSSSAGPSEWLRRDQTYSKLRSLFNMRLDGNPDALADQLGAEVAAAFLEVEELRREIARPLPNRLLIMRFENFHSAVQDLRVEVEVGGTIYDATLNGERAGTIIGNDGDRFALMLDEVPSEYRADVYIWYDYLSVEERIFPDEADYRWQGTQGIRIRNVTIGRGCVRRDPDMLATLEAQNRFGVDPVVSEGELAGSTE